MGSQSDWHTMKKAADILTALGVEHDVRIVSAHRTPDRLVEFAKGAADEGFKVIIAGAGGAAHLPGMVASMTHLPVLGVPVQSKMLSGRTRCSPSCRCPRAFPWALWPSARRARPMRACWPPRSWPSATRS
jgi:5-(carboxyamino)imidazole ribonucleotide mutase